jgi:hypothetical protein
MATVTWTGHPEKSGSVCIQWTESDHFLDIQSLRRLLMNWLTYECSGTAKYIDVLPEK